MTPVVRELVLGGTLDLAHYLRRHLTGDWGEVSQSDRLANQQAILDGGRLFSSYHIGADLNLRFVTDADRLSTAAFLPNERISL